MRVLNTSTCALSLLLYFAVLVHTSKLSIRQISVTGGWALRTPICPTEFQSCKNSTTFAGQDACCPPDTTCTPASPAGDVMCCPSKKGVCTDHLIHPLKICGDPTWTLWTSAYTPLFFCCLPGLAGYQNRELDNKYGEMCLDPGLSTGTTMGGNTLAASSVATGGIIVQATTKTATTTQSTPGSSSSSTSRNSSPGASSPRSASATNTAQSQSTPSPDSGSRATPQSQPRVCLLLVAISAVVAFVCFFD